MKTQKQQKEKEPQGFSSKKQGLRDRSRATHKWACNSCADLHELGAQLVLTSPKTKEIKPAGKRHDMPIAFDVVLGVCKS